MSQSNNNQIQLLLTGLQIVINCLDGLQFTDFNARKIKQLSKELSIQIEKQYSEIFKGTSQEVHDYYIKISDLLIQEIQIIMNLMETGEENQKRFSEKYLELLKEFNLVK